MKPKFVIVKRSVNKFGFFSIHGSLFKAPPEFHSRTVKVRVDYSLFQQLCSDALLDHQLCKTAHVNN